MTKFIAIIPLLFNYFMPLAKQFNNVILEKTHYNDAISISGIKDIKENCNDEFIIKQFIKKKRSLHEAIPRKGRKEPNRKAKRNSKNTKYSRGFYLNDKVKIFNKIGWISGFCNGGCYVKDIEGNYILNGLCLNKD